MEARYEIMIPVMPGLTESALQYIQQALPRSVSHQETRDMYQSGQNKRYNVAVVSTQDTPEADSAMKQIAAIVGGAANTENILVSKTSKDGIQSWPIRNPKFQSQSPQEMPASDADPQPLPFT